MFAGVFVVSNGRADEYGSDIGIYFIADEAFS